jgi:DNA-binding transcriptional regulator GbsR (MarR family)
MTSPTSESDDFDDLEFAEELVALMPGWPPMAGRMLGLLLVTEEPYLSSRDLMERLGASSAWISNMGRLLSGRGVVERTVSVETRRDLFSVRPDAWAHLARETLRHAEQYVKLLDRALASRGESHSSTEKLSYMRDYYQFYCQEFPRLIQRFDERRTARSTSPRTASPADSPEPSG